MNRKSNPISATALRASTSAFCLATAAFVSLAVVGCQTTGKSKEDAAGNTTQTLGSTGASNPKTDFHRDVGPEQEFNVHLEVARMQESQGNHEAAVIEYQKAADVCDRKSSVLAHSKLGPAQQSVAQRRMAAAYDRMGRFAQAEPHYLKALKLTPGDTKVWNDAGYSYYLQSRLADAERAFKQAVSLDPGNPRALTNLGLTQAAQGRDEEALASLCRAGGPAVGHANLGYILAAMGRKDLAREHYEAAINLQPQLVAAKQALAKLDLPPTAPATAIASTAAPSAPVASAVVRTAPPGDSRLTRASATTPDLVRRAPLIPLPDLPVAVPPAPQPVTPPAAK